MIEYENMFRHIKDNPHIEEFIREQKSFRGYYNIFDNRSKKLSELTYTYGHSGGRLR